MKRKPEELSATLREYADALDRDRGHDKSAVTALMREAADRVDPAKLAAPAEGTVEQKIDALRVWVGEGIEEALEEDPSGFLLGVASAGALTALDEIAETLRALRTRAAGLSLVASDLLAVRKREGSCPLCGVARPDCTHVLWAKARR